MNQLKHKEFFVLKILFQKLRTEHLFCTKWPNQNNFHHFLKSFLLNLPHKLLLRWHHQEKLMLVFPLHPCPKLEFSQADFYFFEQQYLLQQESLKLNDNLFEVLQFLFPETFLKKTKYFELLLHGTYKLTDHHHQQRKHNFQCFFLLQKSFAKVYTAQYSSLDIRQP